ncbi:MAG: flagellar hook-basal body protein [Fibrobacterales bacterium]
MVNGLYTASRSMTILQNKVDTVSHNLANANSTAFKKSFLINASRVDIQRNDEYLLHQDEDSKMVESYVDHEQGNFIHTQDPFDLAIKDKGFFAIQTAQGTRYTRNGAFTRNALGNLVTLNGDKVLSRSNDPIHLGQGRMVIDPQGKVYMDEKEIAELKIVDFENKQGLTREGNAYFALENPDVQEKLIEHPDIKQGVLEGSNVNVVDSMVAMIRHHRQYDTNKTSIQSIDSTLDKAVNQVGKV